MIRFAIALAILAVATCARAHDKWWNGKEVDPATKAMCCGDSDIHHLTRDDVRVTPGGYIIKATGETIPHSRVQPSPDGELWQFFWGNETKCFYAPIGAT